MPDDLRTRIAKALWDFACPDVLKEDHPEPGKAFLQMADAVIAELKTDPSIMFMTHVCGEGCSCE